MLSGSGAAGCELSTSVSRTPPPQLPSLAFRVSLVSLGFRVPCYRRRIRDEPAHPRIRPRGMVNVLWHVAFLSVTSAPLSRLSVCNTNVCEARMSRFDPISTLVSSARTST